MLKTNQFQSSVIRTFSLYAVEKENRVENFQNRSEPSCDLKIRRASALGGSTPPPGTIDSEEVISFHEKGEMHYS
jgi:hypothetical protein